MSIGSDRSLSATYSGSGDAVFILNDIASDRAAKVDYALDIGSTETHVYLISTNTRAEVSEVPKIALQPAQGAEARVTVDRRSRGVPEHPAIDGMTRRREIATFNADPPLGDLILASERPVVGPTSQERPQVNDTHTFQDYDGELIDIPSTARTVVHDGVTALVVWVAEESWGAGCSEPYCVDQAMVDSVAAAFLRPGSGNDIFDWVTSIFGGPWGPHEDAALIPPTNDVHILLYDIDNDDSPTGGVLGYFYAKDNFTRSHDTSHPAVAASTKGYYSEPLAKLVRQPEFVIGFPVETDRG